MVGLTTFSFSSDVTGCQRGNREDACCVFRTFSKAVDAKLITSAPEFSMQVTLTAAASSFNFLVDPCFKTTAVG
jgi:hypothetical protein